jgi:NAD(P)-dependent dehydrogenase (short-subunit alcohol dehydrogenase family)
LRCSSAPTISGHRFSDVDLEDPGFEHTPYDPWVSYGRSKTANVLFAVEFDRRHKNRGVRAVAVHPGGIMTELGRHLPEGALEAMAAQIQKEQEEKGGPDFGWKSVPQGAATSVWAGFVAPADEIGGRFAEDCGLSPVVADGELGILNPGVRPYALDPDTAKALWARSEEMVGELF